MTADRDPDVDTDLRAMCTGCDLTEHVWGAYFVRLAKARLQRHALTTGHRVQVDITRTSSQFYDYPMPTSNKERSR